jgi:integrase/recombinase XerD
MDRRQPRLLPAGHRIETTALYTRAATNTIREVMSPLDRLTPLRPKKDETKDATKQKTNNETEPPT